MRVTTMAIALATTLALPTLAMAQSGFPRKDYPMQAENAANAPGANTAQGQVTNRGPRTTTGQASPAPAPMRTNKGQKRSHRTIER